MDDRNADRLRILIATTGRDRTTSAARVVAALGHEVLVRGFDLDHVETVGADVALVEVGGDPGRSLELIGRLVEEATCPVIPLLESPNRELIREASRQGVFAVITDRPGEDWQSAIDIALRRFDEYQALHSAFRRRAVTERAKGILMERHAVDEAEAFRLLREHARATNRKLVDVATAVAVVHALLPGRRTGRVSFAAAD